MQFFKSSSLIVLGAVLAIISSTPAHARPQDADSVPDDIPKFLSENWETLAKYLNKAISNIEKSDPDAYSAISSAVGTKAPEKFDLSWYQSIALVGEKGLDDLNTAFYSALNDDGVTKYNGMFDMEIGPTPTGDTKAEDSKGASKPTSQSDKASNSSNSSKSHVYSTIEATTTKYDVGSANTNMASLSALAAALVLGSLF
ncbi:hypothetical protein H4219_001872 [Mycoemilia scoparia]|uniref:Uncharacterized protein n=1 Tax=Mycoemilia scoparia TaxID=417184 RepID=A0A9W8A3W3_9FUNG|nr:hypothetical protein H4219_001872 [Mycoemilia scoparia]